MSCTSLMAVAQEFYSRERHCLAEALITAGPHAQTLCEGWTTADLAGHLYLRERNPLAVYLGKTHVSGKAYQQIVREWEEGPPWWSPLYLADRWVNTIECFVHHEDVRRAGKGGSDKRPLGRLAELVLMKYLRRFAPMLIKVSGLPKTSAVVLTPPELQPVTVAGRGVSRCGDSVLRVYGDPGELVLWAFGRDAVDVKLFHGRLDEPEVPRRGV